MGYLVGYLRQRHRTADNAEDEGFSLLSTESGNSQATDGMDQSRLLQALRYLIVSITTRNNRHPANMIAVGGVSISNTA